jgi:HEAT repeat protein
LLDDDDCVVRVRAAEALWKIERHPRAFPQLVAELRSNISWAQLNAANAIGRIGPPAKEAVPALVELLTQRNFDVRRAAAAALKAVDPEATPKPESE